MERFKDKINQDTEDQERTESMIDAVQKHMQKKPKRNFLDRESERLMQEQAHEEFAEDEELVDLTSWSH